MRKIYTLLAVLTLGAGLALAQSSPAQSQPDQSQPSQPDQSQQMPQTQQPPAAESQASADSQSLQDQIQKTFQQDSALSGVTVNVTDSQIELSGTVATQADKDKARTQAESSANGRKVVDNIQVSGSQSTPPSQ